MAGESATLGELAGENTMLRSLIYEYLETAAELQERLNATAGMPEEKRSPSLRPSSTTRALMPQ
jgi:hypothetical protein